jgi:hypothetical protein
MDYALDERESIARGDALGLQRAGKGVDFKSEVAEGVSTPGPPRAKGEVVLSQCSDDIGKRLERADKLLEEVGQYDS